MKDLFIVLLVLISTRLSAEERVIEFRVLAYGESLFEDVLFKMELDGEVQSVALEFLPNQRSRKYVIPSRKSELEFFRLFESEDEVLVEVPVGQVRLPREVGRFLFVFFETADFEVSGQYEILVLDESADVWRAGCVRFLNLSGAELQGRIGDLYLDVPIDASEIVCFDERDLSARRLQLMVNWQGKNTIVHSTRFLPDPNYPKLLVIKPPLAENSLKVRVNNLW